MRRLISAITVLLLSLPAWAQPEASRDRGISADRPATKKPQAEARSVVPPAANFCDGANTGNAFNDNVLMGGPIVGFAWTPAATLTITRIEIFTGESTAPIALGIWSDDGGLPSKPLADLGDTGYFNLPSTVNSWQGANLLTPVTVLGGTKYWVVLDPSGGEQSPVENGTGQQYWGSYSGTINSVLPSDWFGPFSFPDRAWKFRVFCVPQPKDVYAVKFLCGNFMPKGSPVETEWPVKPGNYLTAINVHNPNPVSLAFQKKAVLLYRADAPPQPEQPMPPGRLHEAALREDWGMEIDCTDIRTKLLGGNAPPSSTFIKGWVVIEVTGTADHLEPRPLDVTAVYTSHGWDTTTDRRTYAGFAQDVESITPKRVKK